MPTAGRLIAAIALALVGGIFAFLAAAQFDGGRVPGHWYPLCIMAGAWAGWVVIGSRAGRGYSSAISNGWTGAVAMLFWVFFITAGIAMLRKSLRKLYDGPVEAVIDVFQLMIASGKELFTLEVALMLVIGAALSGLVAEFYARRLP